MKKSNASIFDLTTLSEIQQQEEIVRINLDNYMSLYMDYLEMDPVILNESFIDARHFHQVHINNIGQIAREIFRSSASETLHIRPEDLALKQDAVRHLNAASRIIEERFEERSYTRPVNSIYFLQTLNFLLLGGLFALGIYGIYKIHKSDIENKEILTKMAQENNRFGYLANSLLKDISLKLDHGLINQVEAAELTVESIILLEKNS